VASVLALLHLLVAGGAVMLARTPGSVDAAV
jgi:hypothetical protein